MVMKQKIEILKGIHPGKIIARELQKRGISQRAFAASIGEHSQTLNAVITGHRYLTTEMAVKIEQSLGYEECFLLILQAYHETAEYKKRLATLSITATHCFGILISIRLTGHCIKRLSYNVSANMVMMWKGRKLCNSTIFRCLNSIDTYRKIRIE